MPFTAGGSMFYEEIVYLPHPLNFYNPIPLYPPSPYQGAANASLRRPSGLIFFEEAGRDFREGRSPLSFLHSPFP